MKFKKFVKSLASDGVIYECGGERWLASPSALMHIPYTIRSVTGVSIQPMPEAIEKMIYQVDCTQLATLAKALMRYADGGIKDCVRVFSTADTTLTIAISNDDWSLIEKSDFCEILYSYDIYDIDAGKATAKALLVKNYPFNPDDDDELVGIIFPTDYAEQMNFTTTKEVNNNG